MKGIVFNLLEEAVRQEFGEDVWDDLLDEAGLDGAYTSLGNYPDAQLGSLVAAASAKLEQPPEEVVRWFGQRALPMMAEHYPHFFTPHRTTRSFVLTLNDIIHPEVRKIYPGADVPEFDFDTSSDEVLLVGYQSPRRMCALAQGLVEGAAAYFGEEATFEQPQCMHRGDPKCLFRIAFRKREDGRGA
jgi:Haem-NO-binding